MNDPPFFFLLFDFAAPGDRFVRGAGDRDVGIVVENRSPSCRASPVVAGGGHASVLVYSDHERRGDNITMAAETNPHWRDAKGGPGFIGCSYCERKTRMGFVRPE